MSELKAYKNLECAFSTLTQQEIVVAEDSEGGSIVFEEGDEVYLKTEADEVIAEKDKEIAQLQAMLEERNRQIGNLDAVAKRNQSELKEHWLSNGLGVEYACYLKPEVDKVIAEKDKEIARLDDANKTLQLWHDNAVNAMHETEEACMCLTKSERHQKYKRCVARWLYLRECYWRCLNHNEQTRADWYNKWMDVFQKLAEHYSVTDNKEAK